MKEQGQNEKTCMVEISDPSAKNLDQAFRKCRGRQHFHVIWNRVSLVSGRVVWPGHYWLKSKQVCREMEQELGLKRPTPRRTTTVFVKAHRRTKALSPSRLESTAQVELLQLPIRPLAPVRPTRYPPLRVLPLWYRQRHGKGKNATDSETMPRYSQTMGLDELIAWAFANGRLDILAQYGIYLPADYFEP
jgi:hypothetical protein